MAANERRSTRVPAPPAESGAPAGPPAEGRANPAALTVEQLARMLGMPAGKVRDHVAAGAPTGPGGTVNLVHYAAWVCLKLRDDSG